MWSREYIIYSTRVFNFIYNLLKEVEKANLGIQFSSGQRLLFADDFV